LKKPWKAYVFWIALSEAVGALSGWITNGAMEAYNQTVVKPPLSPPDIVFPIVWGILFALMGIGAARVYLAPESGSRTLGLTLFFMQLAVNFSWSIFFFNLMAFGFAFFWILLLWGLIAAMAVVFRQADRPAAYLQIPYLLWVAFAAYLNFATWMLN